jgi:hypothetical protein
VVGGLGLDPVPSEHRRRILVFIDDHGICRPQASAGEAQERVAE